MTWMQGLQLRNRIPLMVSVVVTFSLVYFIEAGVLKKTDGIFMYPLDDPFIHMEIAKNLVETGTWGINPGVFASASSSILYTIILAVSFKIFSVHVVVPFIINCIAACLLLAATHNWLRKQGVKLLEECLIMLAVIFLLPLPILVISGMEHVIHCLLAFLFITRFTDWYSPAHGEKNKNRATLPPNLLLLAFLMTAVRFEGMFFICICTALLVLNRQFIPAVTLMFVAFTPILVFGLYSLGKGSLFFPNPLYIKSSTPEMSIHGLLAYLENILVNKFTIVKAAESFNGMPPPGISLQVTQRLLIILPLCYFLFTRSKKPGSSYTTMILVLLAGTVLHLAFASTGWFYRYEAYLLLPSLMLTAVLITGHKSSFRVSNRLFETVFIVALGFGLFFPFVLRSMAGFTKAQQACINIYQQQYQMARFIKQHYPGQAVAANDIGAIAFFTDARIVDLWGLGDIEIARSRKQRTWSPALLDSIVQRENVSLAVIYDHWFDPELYRNWTGLGRWTISNNVITGGETVSFYSTRREKNADDLKKFRLFGAQLPADVKSESASD